MSSERSACSRQDRRDSAGARLTASAAASTSPGATRAPVSPSTITSGSAPRRNATTGVPQACASAATIPNGSSHCAGQSTTAARAIASHSAVCGTAA